MWIAEHTFDDHQNEIIQKGNGAWTRFVEKIKNRLVHSNYLYNTSWQISGGAICIWMNHKTICATNVTNQQRKY